MSYTKILNYYLENEPYQKNFSPEDRARLVASVQVIELKGDDTLYTSKNPANYIYFLCQGSINLHLAEGSSVLIRAENYFGEESILGLQSHISKATARETCHILQIPVHRFIEIIKKDSSLYNEILAHFSRKFIGSQIGPQKSPPLLETPSVSSFSPVVKWVLSICIPLFFYIFIKDYIEEQNTRLFITFSMMGICLWSFSLTPVYFPPFLVIVSSLILGLAPKSAILSGFSSESFLILFAVLALGKAIASSNILYRTMLKILKFMPSTNFWANTSIFILGLVLTPLIPTAEARQDILRKFTKDFTERLALGPSSSTTTKIALTAYTGTTLFGPIFLTSSMYNFLIFSLLSTSQDHFFLYEWLLNALPTGIFLLVFFTLGLNLFFKENEKPTPFRESTEIQLKILGRLRGREQGLLVLTLTYLVALAVKNYHGISGSHICLLMFSGLIIFNLISQEELNKKLEWPILMLFALLVGTIASFNSLNLSIGHNPLTNCLDPLIRQSFALFVLLLGVILTVIRIFIPYGLTVTLSAAFLLPFAQHYNVNPWLVGFLILLFSKESLIPTSSSRLKYFLKEFSDNNDIPVSLLWRYHIMINLIKFAAVYCSISFWKDMSLI
jgi:DASS family divalent anion:Na+ symporter